MPVSAQAQWYAATGAPPAPAYRYQLQPAQPYAVEVAPGAYVIHRPAPAQDYRPYMGCGPACGVADGAPPRVARRAFARHRVLRHTPAPRQFARERYAPAGRRDTGRTVIETRRVVRDRPVVIVHRRVVDDPPRVIERLHYVDVPAGRGLFTSPPSGRGLLTAPPIERAAAPTVFDGGARVIHADAEITILGPDRMSIRLVRKGAGSYDLR